MAYDTEQKIKTRKDGSIDTGYYMQRGRQQRSDAAMALLRGPERRARRRASAGLFSFLF